MNRLVFELVTFNHHRRYPQPIVRDTSILEQSLPDVVRTGVPSFLLLRRPDIREAELALAAAQADVAAARKAFFPSLVLSPFVGMNAPELAMLVEPKAFAVGLLAGLTAPIFQQNQLRAGYGRATAETLEASLGRRLILSLEPNVRLLSLISFHSNEGLRRHLRSAGVQLGAHYAF